VLDIEFEFARSAINRRRGVPRLGNVNAVIVDEADLQPEALVPYLTVRVGALFRPRSDAGCRSQIILSLNMPDIDNHIYRLLMEESLAAWTNRTVPTSPPCCGDVR
jgi:hypothetical protein